MSRDAVTQQAEELAGVVIAKLNGVPAETLYSLADALQFAAGPVQEFRLPIFYLACDRECGERPDFMARLTMRGALKAIARQPTFLEELADAQTVFWKAVHDAGVAIAEQAPSRPSGPAAVLTD